VKMFYIWITVRCYFAFLSIDMLVFFTRYSLRCLSLKLDISSIKLLLLYKVYDIRFPAFRNYLLDPARRIRAIAL